jgi:hypothetical protein
MANTTTITAEDLQDMVGHCLATPPGGYLGSDYGADVASVLMTPMASGAADALIDKIRQDVPLLQVAPADTVNIYSYQAAFDKVAIVVEVAGKGIDLGATA